MTIKSTQSGCKTYNTRDVTGKIRPIKTLTLYVPDLEKTFWQEGR
jgi:hypothetical protein